VIAAAGLVLVLVLGGVGTAVAAPQAPRSISSTQVSASSWTHKVCQSLSRWETKVKSLSSSVSKQVQGESTIAGIRTLLTQFLQKVVDSTSQLVRQMDAAGTPKVDQGKAVAQFFHDGLTQLKNLFAQSQQAVKGLPNNPRAFATRAESVGRQIDNGGKQIQGVFNDAQTRFHIPAIDAAFSSDPACTSIHQ
jgi:hypothetical protein